MRALMVATLALLVSAPLTAQDQPSAILIYPYVATQPSAGIETTIQLTNVTNDPVEVRCVYEDFTPDCVSGSAGEFCGPGPVTCSGVCTPPINAVERVPLRISLTANQPIAWQLSRGLIGGPLDGVERIGPGGQHNQLTNIPAIVAPMFGTLRCTVTDSSGAAKPDNAVVGLATVTESTGGRDDWQYRATGLRSLPGVTDPSADGSLRLGGVDAEYEACPAILQLDHFFDNGPLLTGDVTAHVEPSIAVTTCGMPQTGAGGDVLQYLVYNEYGQRFSTSRPMTGLFVSRLAQIDTIQVHRSIFSVDVANTLSGQTVISGVNGGLVAVGVDRHVYSPEASRSVGYNVHGAGARDEGDLIAFSTAPYCVGDCNRDGLVRVNELVSGVNIALEQVSISTCEAMDGNADTRVTVNELVIATNALLGSCPSAPVPTPTVAVAAAAHGDTAQGATTGPEVTVLVIATADDRPLEPDATDDEGRDVFERPYGQGMTIVIEGRGSPRQLGRSSYNDAGALPDLQILVSNALGDGAEAVCENDGRTGGIPGNPELDFDADGATAAINDLGCRAFDRNAGVGRNTGGFTKLPGANGVWDFVNSQSQQQWGIPIAKAWAFPVGRTIIAARVRDTAGELSPVKEIVVDVAAPPAP